MIKSYLIFIFDQSVIYNNVCNKNRVKYIKKVVLLLLFAPLEFFTSVIADGFSLEFE